MLHITNFGARCFSIAILGAVFTAIVVIYRRVARQGKRPWIARALGGYGILLVALFIFGQVADTGYGWTFLPVMVFTAPWSFMVSMVPRGIIMDWFASGWFGNFVLIVVICGGLNSLLLYVILRKVFYSSESQTDQSLLGGRPKP